MSFDQFSFLVKKQEELIDNSYALIILKALVGTAQDPVPLIQISAFSIL